MTTEAHSRPLIEKKPSWTMAFGQKIDLSFILKQFKEMITLLLNDITIIEGISMWNFIDPVDIRREMSKFGCMARTGWRYRRL